MNSILVPDFAGDPGVHDTIIDTCTPIVDALQLKNYI